MKLTPLADRVVLKMTEAEETTKGGIILTGSAPRRSPPWRRSFLWAPAAPWTAKTVVMTVKPGDKVITDKYAGHREGHTGGRGVRDRHVRATSWPS